MAQPQASARPVKDRPSLYQEIRHDYRAVRGRPRTLGLALVRFGRRTRHAAQRLDRLALFRDQYLILWNAVIARGFTSQSWLTFRQALTVGGNVRKGERGTTIVHADRFTPDEERRQ